MEIFLKDDTIIPLHSSSLEDPDACLDYAFDTDGLVIQLEKLVRLEASLYYIYLPKIEQHHLRAQWSILKKRATEQVQPTGTESIVMQPRDNAVPCRWWTLLAPNSHAQKSADTGQSGYRQPNQTLLKLFSREN